MSDRERIYQAIEGTSEPWGGCHRRDAVDRVEDLLAEAERRGAERAWDDALDLAGDESFDVRGKLCGESDWTRVEDLFWDHLGEMQKANPYRAGDDQ